MSHSSDIQAAQVTTGDSAIEKILGFVTCSAVSVGTVYLLAAAFTAITSQLMRYEVLEISRGFGGVI